MPKQIIITDRSQAALGGAMNRKGLLWFDDSKTTKLEDKINRASKHYEERYGIRSVECMVHPSLVGGKTGASIRVGEVTLTGSWQILPDHFWLLEPEAPIDNT